MNILVLEHAAIKVTDSKIKWHNSSYEYDEIFGRFDYILVEKSQFFSKISSNENDQIAVYCDYYGGVELMKLWKW